MRMTQPKRWSKHHIIEKLSKEGLVFSEFALTDEGEYAIDDADWNYKDIPHLHHIHELVEAYPTTLQDDLITSLNIQKVLGIKTPLSVVNYQSGTNEQTYYTTWFFFILIVRTHYEKLTANRTRVVTTYNIGSPPILKWCTPLIRFLIRKNYRNLMSGDIPMRHRRGELRSWGYTFRKKGESYTFPETTEILQKNVILPQPAQNPTTIDILNTLPHNGEYLVGRSDHMGVRLSREANRLDIYPRMCPHEGALLDHEKCVNRKVKCPWHGRLHSPMASFEIDSKNEQTHLAEKYNLSLTWQAPTLTIKSLTVTDNAILEAAKIHDIVAAT